MYAYFSPGQKSKTAENGHQPKYISWWPKPTAFWSSGLNTGWWNANCERWFVNRLREIETKPMKLYTYAEWKMNLRFSSAAHKVNMENNEIAAHIDRDIDGLYALNFGSHFNTIYSLYFMLYIYAGKRKFTKFAVNYMKIWQLNTTHTTPFPPAIRRPRTRAFTLSVAAVTTPASRVDKARLPGSLLVHPRSFIFARQRAAGAARCIWQFPRALGPLPYSNVILSRAGGLPALAGGAQ
ncbi:hypothetical protein C8J57DRAFT_1638090 [Mycena rebaudengoi]|nr:hypothetical protein C8J57DRAFT_1638090 [Mycena rebaudengoi]